MSDEPNRDDRARDLAEQAFDLGGAALRRFVEGIDDDALRAEVRSLVDADEAADAFLADPTASEAPLHTPAPGSGEGPGTVIGRYKLLQLVGEGGFGSVYMAEQREPVKRRVAIKIIKLGMDTRQVIARFEAERQALAMMDHPNIAKVLDAGATETGRPFFVMELVKGVPLTEYCDTNNLPTRERLDLFVTICGAVQHAHQKGIIHRDLKPSNVMITLHDGKPVPKVIDFGIAKATSRELTEKTLFTEYHQFIGTPQYMSPEQAEMSGLDIDTRSDIYSLGVMLYELLTGTTPFDGEKLRSAAFGEIQRIIREEEPPRPSTRLSTMGEQITDVARHRRVEPSRLTRALRGDLDWIVMTCLEKDRTRRYETASGLARDIERHLADEPVVAGPPSTRYRIGKLIRRHRVAVSVAGLALALVLLGLAGTTWGMVSATEQRDVAVAARLEALAAQQLAGERLEEADAARAQAERAAAAEAEQARAAEAAREVAEAARAEAERQTARANANYEFLLWGVGVANAAYDGAEDLTVRQMLDLAADRIGERYVDKPEYEAAVRSTIGHAYHYLGEYRPAYEQLDAARTLLEQINAPPDRRLVGLLVTMGLCARELGLGEMAAQRWNRESVIKCIELLQRRHPEIGAAAQAMATALIGPARPAEELITTHLDALLAALADTPSANEEDAEAVAVVVMAVGTFIGNTFGGYTHADRRLWNESLRLTRRSTALSRRPLGIALWCIVRSGALPGDEERHVRLARELVAQMHEDLPREHWFRADADGLLGYALAARGRPEDRDEAARLLVQSYEQLREEKLIPARIYHALLRLVGYAPAGDLATAVHARSLGHPLVIETLDAALGDLPPDPELHNLIAWSLARWSGLEPARYEIALRAARRADTLAPDNPLVLNTLGVAQYRTGADEAAIAMLTRADERAVEAELGSQPANWAFIAMAHHRLDQQGQARAALARLEQLMQDPAHARADENRAFLAEARTLLAAAESAG